MIVPPEDPAWADLKAEIDRKATEAMFVAVHKHEQGEISERELWLIANSVHDVIQGLATVETTDMIYAIRQELTAA